MVTSSGSGMNTWISTYIFMLTVFWLKLGAYTSWSKELYLITHRWQAAYTIRPQPSSVLVLKMIFKKVMAPGKTDVAWERELSVPLNTWGASEHTQDISAFCQPKKNLCEHNCVAQVNDCSELHLVPLALRDCIPKTIPKYTLHIGFRTDWWQMRSFSNVFPAHTYYTRLLSWT